MRTTFEELLGKGNKLHGEVVYNKNHVLKVLELVRQKTLEECVELPIEESFLNLPKDSIKYNKDAQL